MNTCLAGEVAMGGAAAATVTVFRLFNRGNAAISEVTARPPGAEKWSANHMRGGLIAPGGDRMLAIPPGGGCVFDLRVTFADGRTREKHAADLCKSPDQGVQ